jgi:hypothetical protein
VLTERLARESKLEFPTAQTADQILKSDSAKPAEVSPMPKLSAYDLLLEINAKLPEKAKVTLDIGTLEITDQKVTIRGSAKTDEEIDAITAQLKGIKCFTETTSGTRETGPKGERKFQLNIVSTCM